MLHVVLQSWLLVFRLIFLFDDTQLTLQLFINRLVSPVLVLTLVLSEFLLEFSCLKLLFDLELVYYLHRLQTWLHSA